MSVLVSVPGDAPMSATAALGRRRRRSRGQAGFTLIELMVALLISSILVMMVLSVFSRMSSAYRRQQQVAALQVILSAGQNMIAQDARQAGFQIANGFRLGSAPGTLQMPVRIFNSSTAPDEVRFYSADATVQAKVLTMPAAGVPMPSITLAAGVTNPFVIGELAVIVNTDTGSLNVTTASGSNGRVVSLFRACVVRVTSAGASSVVSIDTANPWGNANNSHCDEVRTKHNDTGATNLQTMIYRFRARGYRIDPARAALGVLQLSPSGGLVANDWQDLGVGFTDLQVAARFFRDTSLLDPDADGRVQYNWYSGAAMQTATDPVIAANTNLGGAWRLTRLSISLLARTDRTVDGVATAATPAFIQGSLTDYNQLGDRASVVLNPADRVYRYTTNRIDMRNTGAGL